jgi:hypothetical protein
MDSLPVKDYHPRIAGVIFLAFLVMLSACSPEKPKTDPRQEQMESMMAILAQVQNSPQASRTRNPPMSHKSGRILRQVSVLSIPRCQQVKTSLKNLKKRIVHRLIG